MTPAARHVAPEDIMAWLDQELPPSERSAVATHVDHCQECFLIATELRDSSTWLAQWEVPPPTAALDAEIAARLARSRPARFSRMGRKPWAAGIGAFAVSLLVFAVARNVIRPLPLRDAKAFSRLETSGPFKGERQSVSESVSAAAPLSLHDNASTLIARTASLNVEVVDFDAARAALDRILATRQGYIVHISTFSSGSGPRNATASMRIPAPALADALKDLRNLGRVQFESQSGEEVTQQHADLVQRLKTARETEDRFRAILAQRTGSVADVLQVEEAVTRVRGDIERMEAEQATLDHRVSFASVELQLTEPYKASLSDNTDSLSVRFHNALVAGWSNGSETIVGILLVCVAYGPTLAIWIALLGVPAWLLIRRYRRLRNL